MMENTLFYGDNLDILREHIDDESVDLVYLDPPFNSNRSYNVLFRDESGRDSDAQITAFEDSWHWSRATEDLYADLVTGGVYPRSGVASGDERLVRLLGALVGGQDEQGLLGRNQMSAYLVMMAARLVELHRVLKPSGSLYLHCDPTASHYLKMLLDGIFGAWNFRNEITWQRTESHNTAERYGNVADILFYYARSETVTWNHQYQTYSDAQLSRFKHTDSNGRKYKLDDLTAPRPDSNSGKFEWRGTMPGSTRGWGYKIEQLEEWWEQGRIHTKKDGTPRMDGLRVYLDESLGKPVQNIWTDIPRIANTAKERLGYPTQKPLALLERIIRASSNPGEVVLDPFCGCGTAIDAAEGLKRRWIGIDITHLSVALMKYRLQDRHGLRPGQDYRVIGEPQDLAGARALAQQTHDDGRYQFEWWALSLVGARPLRATGGRGKRGKKGADSGVDGVIHFLDEDKRTQRVVVQVKSGANVSRRDIGDLRGVLDAGAAMAVFITLEPPTRPMQQEAISAGHYESEVWGRYPRLQILTIEELLAGDLPRLPRGRLTFQEAQFAREKRDAQGRLL